MGGAGRGLCAGPALPHSSGHPRSLANFSLLLHPPGEKDPHTQCPHSLGLSFPICQEGAALCEVFWVEQTPCVAGKG